VQDHEAAPALEIGVEGGPLGGTAVAAVALIDDEHVRPRQLVRGGEVQGPVHLDAAREQELAPVGQERGVVVHAVVHRVVGLLSRADEDAEGRLLCAELRGQGHRERERRQQDERHFRFHVSSPFSSR
jgi:hypothetical protein